MAGLLDFEDPRTMGLLNAGLGIMAQAGDTSRQFGLGQALASGLNTYQQTQLQDEMLKRKKAEQDIGMQMNQMQLGQMQQQIKDQEASKQRAAMLPQILAKYGNDYSRMVRDGVVSPEFAKQLAESQNYGKSKVARTVETVGKDGNKIVQQFDELGNAVGDGISAYIAPEKIDLGDKVVFSLPKVGASFTKGMSAADRDASAHRWAGFNLQKEQQYKPTWNNELGSFIEPPSKMFPQGRKIELAGYNKPDKPMTEDQAKSSGWLTQAENAWKNMQEAGTSGLDKNGNYIIKESSRPGFNDVLEKVPSFGLAGGVANNLRGADRQRFLQASKSLSEAALRAATGAGMNEYEAKQKVEEITPQIGDSDEVIQQKYKSVPLFLEGLKMRAGSGAPKVQNILNNSGKPATGAWGIERVN